MRFNILGLDQIKAVELGLNLDELMILRHLHDFTSSGKMETVIHNGEMYYWVNYNKFIEDLPILGMKKTRIMEIFNNNLSEKPLDWDERLNNMSESSKKRAKSFKHIGLLKSFTKKDKTGTYSYFTFTKLFYSLIPSITDNDESVNKKADAPQQAPAKETNKNKSYNPSVSQNKTKYNGKKTSQHIINQRGLGNYDADELEKRLLENQKQKWDW